MTPNKLAKESEHSQQVALFAYVAVARIYGFDIADEWCKTGKLPKYDVSPEGLPRDMQDDEIERFGRVVTWSKAVPALEWFHAIPNGGSRGDDEKSRKIRGGQMKAEGVRQGVADTFLPWPVYEQSPTDSQQMVVKWCGLYIEMKKPSLRPKSETAKGGASDEQIAFGQYAQRVGYGWAVCYDWEQAVCYLRSYIEWGQK
ncbi:hypothetical protein IVIADoCa8_39 [Xanthomonas phage vB_Xar_IVIA-DoCa8]|nr:hypothetical protein IVIADoCa8_39 [Xanthomonas phage vB_Xar_IVIA-DoCa8]